MELHHYTGATYRAQSVERAEGFEAYHWPIYRRAYMYAHVLVPYISHSSVFVHKERGWRALQNSYEHAWTVHKKSAYTQCCSFDGVIANAEQSPHSDA